MPAAPLALAMSSFFNPSFAFSSHFDPDGAPLGELSWSSSLAVVAVSFSGLFTVVALMLACLCCKKGGIGFKEFENAEGEEYAADFCVQDTPVATAPNGPDVYVLPLTEVSLPMAKQPGRSVQLLKSSDVGRSSLLYLEEIGHGWFGKVLLGEVSAGGGSTRVVVKELKASASVRDQAQFLEEARPYRALQHSNLLRCLAQCAEVTPYLLVMESCPLGDLKGYLRSCRVAESMVPDPLTLQRMACEVACGVLHLHRGSYVHSDLALRNCLLAADLTVKVGDYGLAHHRYREDYFVTADQLWVPLRWIAPELVDEVHGNLLVVDQTRASNVWSLGVTVWELFELGVQPYPQHSDREVLAFAVREQQLKLPKPQLQLPLSDRWYEVMQFCWLQPEQRPTAEEVHLLLTYLCAQGSTEEEEFERRWRSLRPGAGGGGGGAGPTPGGAGELAAASSFPLLEQFAGDGFHADGDDVLTVTETSRGLNFEYKWEAGRGAEAFPPAGSAPSPGRAARLQELCALDGAPPGVVPVLSAHSPSVGSEYFIRLEEPAPAAGHDPDCADCMPSPRAPALRREGPDGEGDSDGSAAASLVMEPLLGHPVTTGGSWGRRFGDTLCRGQGEGPPCPSRSPSPSCSALMLAEPGAEDPDWGEAAFCPPFFEDPLGTSPLGTSPGGESLGEAEGRRTAQHRHWSSNESANNNSARRTPQLWGPHGSPATEQVPQDLPEPSHPLAPEDPREPLLGLQVVSSCKEQGCRPDPSHLTLHLSAEAVAPAAGLATPLWAEAAIAGGDSPQAEPRLAGEAESTPGSQPPLPSIPSPSQEGAPLPAEAASAPTTLPASPATSSQTTATGAAWARDGGGRPPEPEAPGGTGEDVPEATPGTAAHQCCAGPRDEGLCVAPAACAPQKQVGTPGSLHVSSLASGGGREVFSPSAAGTPGGQPRALDSGYDTENYESPEFVLKEAHEPGGPEAFGTQLSAPLGSLGEKSPYRDSAYFSDLDAEPEPPVGPEGKQREVPAPGLEPGLEGLSAPGLQSARESLESGVLRAVPPLPLSPDPCPEPSACHADPELEAPGPRGPAQVPLLPSPGCSQSFLLTPGPAKPESPGPELQEALGLLSGRALQARTSGPCGARAPLCLALPGLPAAPESRAEEEEDSEDSDESDEELRCYSVQEPSEESEEEAPPVPVVVAESQSARNLRSLLKMPSLLSEAFCEDLERKKKAVSFFDDVTVYLFDQESPTRELGDPFPGAKESAPGFSAGSPGSPVVPSPPSGAHESSQEGSAAPEGGKFEWEDRFPLLRPEEPAGPAVPTAAAPGPFSRFTVSPAPASRFSITQVSDSDAGSVGGSVAGAGGSCKEA